jgi:hypothetical protein
MKITQEELKTLEVWDITFYTEDEPDYDYKLLPKIQALFYMVDWIVPEAWENGVGEAFKKEKAE